jgi:asparagine synthase (glutamine-hydrolysing)
MSGIAGIYRFDGGSVEADTVAAMTEAIDHRGPDGEWTWREGRAGLGHQRFETTPEAEHASSPPERDGRVLTFDGRIDNREELLAELDVAGPPERVADADLVLAAHERWGEDCPERLIGAFAFAIFDPDAERLFLARDHVGLRPFYYYRGEDRFLFGSELKALWAAGGVPRRLDEERVADMLSSWFDNDEYTFHEGILRLPPAHSMLVDGDGVESTEYWSLDPNRTIRFESDEQYAERFRELFEEAVRCRLRTVGPVGSTLSGGLDSSSNVAMACHLADAGEYDGEIHTFSAVFDDERTPSSDEREYIRAVTDEMDVVAHRIQADEHSPLEDINEVLWYNENPNVGNNFYLHWNVYRKADENDVRVLFDGMGGDTTVSHGLGYLPELLLRGQLLTYAREVRLLDERFEHAMSKRGLLWNQTVSALVPNAAKRGWHRLRGRDFRERTNPAFDETFLERIEHRERIDEKQLSKARTERGRHSELITGSVLLDSIKRANKTAMRFEVEPRYPFLDRRLMEYCFALPPDQKLRDGWSRLVLRRGMAGVLPEEIQWRGGKGHLSASFWTALRDHAQEDIAAALDKEEPHTDRFLNVEFVREEYDSLASGDRAGLRTLWFPTLLECWLASHPCRNN